MTVAVIHPEIIAHAATDDAVRSIGLGKTIDDRAILTNLSFTITHGSFVALLGANGAGKTTLLKILATLIAPTCGELTVLGSEVKGDVKHLRARLGLIGHSSMLYRDLSVLDNLIFFGRLYGIKDPHARAATLLDYVGLSTRSNDAVKTYSRGMIQRAAIARALMHDPDLILADEPFAGLDAPSRDSLEKMLRRLHNDGHTIVLANHDIGQTLELTQKALVLQRGRIAIDARTADLTVSSVLEEISRP